MSVIPKPHREFKAKSQPQNGDARRRILSLWRGVDLTSEETARCVRHRTPADLLPNLMTQFHIESRKDDQEVIKVWNEALDPQIVAHAQPTGLNKGTLFVTVDSSPWLDEIVRYHRKPILHLLQNSFGIQKIIRISFRLG